MLMLTSADFQPDDPEPADDRDYTYFPGFTPDPLNERPLARDKTTPCTITFDEHATPKPTLNIACTLRFFNAEKAGVIKLDVYQAFKRFVKDSIEAVWNSATNEGMSPDYSVQCTITVAEGTTRGPLDTGEIFIAVKRKLGHARSFIDALDFRAGVFYVNDDFTKYRRPDPAKDADFAHEFGHVLGLRDRYAYLCYFVPPAKVVADHGHTVPLYVDGDTEYSENYRWLFNLMSRVGGVPDPAKLGQWKLDAMDTLRQNFVHVQQTKRFLALYGPTAAVPAPKGVFITKRQLKYIIDGEQETIFGRGLVYFKELDGQKLGNETYNPPNPYTTYEEEYIFKGTFVGIIPDSSGGSGPGFQVVHDDRYDVNRNTLDPPGSSNGPTSTALSADSEMQFRCRVVPQTGPTPSPGSLPFASGLINASLDLEALADRFSESTTVRQKTGKGKDGSPVTIAGTIVPRDLRKLLELQYLDDRVCIRRFAGDYVQQHINGNHGSLVAVDKVGTVIKSFSYQDFYKIRRVDFATKNEIFNSTDLFATDEDLLDRLTPMADGVVSLKGLFVPYDYDSQVTSFNVGRTWFYTQNESPGDGVKILITDRFQLSPLATTNPVGTIYGRSANDISRVNGIWNSKEILPRTSELGKPAQYVLKYSANDYTNRIALTALVRNGALKSDKSDLDPSNYSLNNCFEIGVVGYPDPTDKTKTIRYATVEYLLGNRK